MTTSLILTVIGPDRPGLVESVASAVTEHGGNWVESRMARLAGQFAGILRVDAPADKAQGLADALRRLKASGLDVTITPGSSDEPQSPARELNLELLGHDRPGIVRQVSSALASRGVNVIELRTELFSAAMSGDPMFRAQATLSAPSDMALDELRRSFDDIEAQLGVDITLTERQPGVAAARPT